MDPILRTVLLGGVSFYPGASVALDFIRQKYRTTGAILRDPSAIPGWTFTRASTGYAETAAGALISFASGAPRITDKGLLVEEARTNYALRSQELDNATWIKTNMAVTADDTLAPDGTQTADKVYVSSVAAGTTTYQNVSPGAGTSIAVTLYAKKGTSATTVNEFGIRDVTGAVTLLVFTVNYDTLAVTYSTGASGVTVTQCANGWIRIQMLLSWTSGNTCRVYCGYATGTRTLNDYAYVWGLQVEIGTFATSYIPATTASATRAADVAAITGLNGVWPHTVVAEWMRVGGTDASTFYRVLTTSLTGTQTTAMYQRHTNNVVRAFVTSTADVGTGIAVIGAVTKAAARFEANNVGISLNGAAVETDTTVTALPYDKINLGCLNDGTTQLTGYLRRLIIYPYALTDAQLVAAST